MKLRKPILGIVPYVLIVLLVLGAEFIQVPYFPLISVVLFWLSIVYLPFPKKIAARIQQTPLVYLLPIYSFIVYLIIRVINPYNLYRFQVIKDFCQINSQACGNASEWFYTLKIYRLVTLSPQVFFYLGGVMLLIYYHAEIRQWVKKTASGQDIISQFFFLLLFILIINHGAGAFNTIVNGFVKTTYAIDTQRNERFEEHFGGRQSIGFIYSFAEFINKYVHENEILFIPPQSGSFVIEGNAQYIRYFIYPRKTTSAEIIEGTEIPEDADWILITYGLDWHQEHVWPRFTIPSEDIERIYLLDRPTGEVTELENTEYTPSYETEQYGLIKLKE